MNKRLEDAVCGDVQLEGRAGGDAGMTVTGSYVGGYGRLILGNLDVAQPNNFIGSAPNQSSFKAETAYERIIDAEVPVTNMPNSGYFQDLFSKATYTRETTPALVPAGTYTSTYYAHWYPKVPNRATGDEPALSPADFGPFYVVDCRLTNSTVYDSPGQARQMQFVEKYTF